MMARLPDPILLMCSCCAILLSRREERGKKESVCECVVDVKTTSASH